MNSYSQLVELGTGRLEVNVLTGTCEFEGQPIDQLIIAGALQSWLTDDLLTHRINPASLLRAKLVAALELSNIDSKQRVTSDHHMSREGKVLEEGTFHRLAIHCTSEVATDEKVYRSEYSDIEEFPPGWPAA